MKKKTIIEILYILAALGYFTYLATKESEFMFFGGLLMIAASIMLTINNKNKI